MKVTIVNISEILKNKNLSLSAEGYVNRGSETKNNKDKTKLKENKQKRRD